MFNLLYMLAAAGTALTNTASEGVFVEHEFPAGSLSPGKVIEFDALVRVTASTSTHTLQTKLRWGTSATPGSNTAVATATAVDATDGAICVVRVRIHCQTATRAVITATLNDCDAEGRNVEAYSEILTISQTTAYRLQVTGVWSTADALDSAQAEAASCWEMAA